MNMRYYEGLKAWFSVLKFWIFALNFSAKNCLVTSLQYVEDCTSPTSALDFFKLNRTFWTRWNHFQVTKAVPWQKLINLYKEGTHRNLGIKILSKYLVLFLDPKLLEKSAVRFVLWWNSLKKIIIFPFWVGIWTQNLKFLSS
jgi:hypothetical protein